jgi:hypothetical protein
MTDQHTKSTATTNTSHSNTGPSVKSESKDYMLCSEEKERHDQCFHRWLHEKFLKGEAKQDDCAPIWTQYEECMKRYVHIYSQVRSATKQ